MARWKVAIEKFDWVLLPVFVIAVAFFFATSWFNRVTQSDDYRKWLSPDESANYVFAKLYAETGEIKIYEKYNLIAQDIIRPRSVRSDHGVMKPVSFLGLIIFYGTLARQFGVGILSYITPVIGAFGILVYYLFVKRLLGRPTALAAAAMLAALPPYFYYASRSFFHNHLFLVAALLGFYLLSLWPRPRGIDTSQPPLPGLSGSANILRVAWLRLLEIRFDWRGYLLAAGAGLALGLAISARSSELLWLAPALLVLWLFNWRRAGLLKPILTATFILLALLPTLHWNTVLYGSPWSGGYPEMNASLQVISASSGEIARSAAAGTAALVSDSARRIFDTVFHFGFRPYQSAKMGYYYFFRLMPWLFVGSIVGALIFFARPKHWRRRYLAYLAAYLLLGSILIFYYGSWEFYDNPDPRAHTLGNSYTRYWLPVYLGALPFLAWLIISAAKSLVRPPILKRYLPEGGKFLGAGLGTVSVFAIAAALVIIIDLLGLAAVFVGSDEGLVYAAQKQHAARREYDTVLALTEGNSVIITEYHDKLFFPERKVIVGLFDDANMNAIYARLVPLLPVYYYNFTLPEASVAYLNRSRLGPLGIEIEPVRPVTGDFTLYRLIRSPESAGATTTPVMVR